MTHLSVAAAATTLALAFALGTVATTISVHRITLLLIVGATILGVVAYFRNNLRLRDRRIWPSSPPTL